MPAPPRVPTGFRDILELIWWRLDCALDLEIIEWSAKLGALEALERGCTAIIDHHESPNAIEGSLSVIADACAEVGVRVSTAYGVTDRHGAEGARRGLAENDRYLSAGGRGLVGVHAAFTCTDDTLAAAAELATKHGVGVHIHVAEGPDDGEAADRIRDLTRDDWLIVHGVHLPDDHGLAGTIVHNPRSNMNNAVGYARPARFANPVALGTDGIGADMLDEFRLAYVRHREARRRSFTRVGVVVAGDQPCIVPGSALRPRAVGLRADRPVATRVHHRREPKRGAHRRRGRVRRRRVDSCRRRRGPCQGGRGRAAAVRAVGGVMTRLALYLQDAHTITEAIAFSQYAEERGFEAVWQADSRLVREASVPMAAFAASTERIKIGSGVIDVWSRNPARLASMFSTLDDLAPGRILCGLGAWWDPLAAKVGIDRAKPLTVMREVVTVVRQLLANENVTFHGEYVHVDGIELDYVYQERRAKDVPIYIGATGMKMMELTGEIADGVVLNYLVSPDYNARALDALAVGAERGGRSVDDIDRPQLVVCSVHEDRATALDMARNMVTQYLGQQPHIMKASGVPQELLDEVGKVLTWPATHEQVEAAAKLVPDEIVQMLTASGTPDEAQDAVATYMRHGCTCPILYPLGDVHAMIDAFAGWQPPRNTAARADEKDVSDG